MKAAPLLVLVCALAAHAEAPPVDPWTDAAWQDVMFGLPRGKVARVRATQQLFDIHTTGAPGAMSTRDVQLEFDAPGGRVSRLVVNEERRGERGSNRSLRYVYEAGHLRRIDEDGHATPAVTRRYDDAGRPIEHTERAGTGAVVARTTWRYDAAGRLLERNLDSGTGSRSRETRRYRQDGTLERLQLGNGKRVEFDTKERPVRIEVTDLADRCETNVAYPSPTEAVHATTGVAMRLRDGSGPYAHTTHYRVRMPQELRGVEVPELPTMRRHVRGAFHDEVQTEYDDRGRILAERRVDAAGNVGCTGRITYHASGPPVTMRNERARPNATCQGSEIDNDIKVDEQGNWAEQRMSLVQPDGQRRLMSVQTRRVEYVR